MGIALPMNGTIPAPDSRRSVLAEQSGKRIVDLVNSGTTISQILTRKAFENAVRVNGAVGGSTNVVVHLLALAGRLGVEFSLNDWDELGRDVPCLVDLKPSGRFLMEEFYYAGGLPVVMQRIREKLNLDARTVEGGTIGDRLGNVACYDDEVIRPRDNPLTPDGGIMVLKGNLAPDGAIIKPSAATPRLMKHRGRALVFETADELREHIDDDDLDVDADTILVLKNAGPRGYPGMPEVGTMALPKKLLAQGVTDMVRISDARMSGTAFGTVVLHVAPESALGGPLALVKTGDMIILDTAARKLELDVPSEEMERRRKAFVPPPPAYERGYGKLYIDHVTQANEGVDFDFLRGKSGTPPSKFSF
jgi:dihydroxy-acid dehydratase